MFAAFDGRRQVGFARVVTDRATFAWLCDVFVAPDARGQGIARRIMQAVLAHDNLIGLRQIVLATKDAHGLYEKFDFKAINMADSTFMRIYRPPSEIYGDPLPGES